MEESKLVKSSQDLMKLTNVSSDHRSVLKSNYDTLLSVDNKTTLKMLIIFITKLCAFIKSDVDSVTMADLTEDMHKMIYFIKIPEVGILFDYLKQAKYITRSPGEILRHTELWCDRRALIAEDNSVSEDMKMAPEVLTSWYNTVKKKGIRPDAIDRKKETLTKESIQYKSPKINTDCPFCGRQIIDPCTGDTLIVHDRGKCKDNQENPNPEYNANVCPRCGERNINTRTGETIKCKCLRKSYGRSKT